MTMEPLRVLVVDDHERVPQRASRPLLPQTRAGGGRGVPPTAGRRSRWRSDLQPDVVLMDLQMPQPQRRRGHRRASSQSSPHISVLVLTMMEDDDSVFAAVRAWSTSSRAPDAPRSSARSRRSARAR